MPRKMPAALGPGGGPLHHMCADGKVTGVPHHAQVASQPPRCKRHYDLYMASQDADRQRKARGQDVVGEDWDRGPNAPEETGSLLLDPDDVGFLAEVLHKISKARLRMIENSGRPERHADAVKELDQVSKALSDFFFDDLGLTEIVERRI